MTTMVSVAQTEERWSVTPEVAGSIPVRHPCREVKGPCLEGELITSEDKGFDTATVG